MCLETTLFTLKSFAAPGGPWLGEDKEPSLPCLSVCLSIHTLIPQNEATTSAAALPKVLGRWFTSAWDDARMGPSGGLHHFHILHAVSAGDAGIRPHG